MRIDLSTLDLNSFNKKSIQFCGQDAWLVTPREMGCDWNQDNVIFRSSVWSLEGDLLSAGFKKFVNYGEKPDVFPVPTDLLNNTVLAKLDGSLLICDYVNGIHNFRTRGTADATLLDNGAEIEILKKKYPKVLDFMSRHPELTLLFEWVSAVNVIVLRYEDCPDIRLLGVVNKDDYSYILQSAVDFLALQMEVKRPEKYDFNTVDGMIHEVKSWEGREGVCVYYNDDQSIVKIKADDYLRLHRLKSALGSLKAVAELYFSLVPLRSYDEFYKHVNDQFDFEIAESCKDNIRIITDRVATIDGLRLELSKYYDEVLFPINLKHGAANGRKKVAEAIFSGPYKEYAPYLFNILSGKMFGVKEYEKIFWQMAEKN
jgi:hypothetical protein